MTASWLGRSARETAAGARLFCFAHAGGGAAFFHPWRAGLLPDVEVCPVTLPGREARAGERAATRMDEVVDPVTQALASLTDRPYAVFGHSMGAAVAYEVARRLESSGVPGPRCLFVSGRRAPHLPSRRPPLHGLPDQELLSAVAELNGTPDGVLRHDDLLRLFLPTLRADFALNETYRPLPGTALRCAVSSLTGDADPQVDLDEIAGWRAVTSGAFTLRVFRGEHFYLKGAPPEVVAAVRSDLRRYLGPVLHRLPGAQFWAEHPPGSG
ncbi:MAG TPA: alpha/beta fold hydrolase [Kineosporiaceae bacterium]